MKTHRVSNDKEFTELVVNENNNQQYWFKEQLLKSSISPLFKI
jgi:hypothetical protein